MKFSTLAAAIAGAGIAQVTATPIRIITISQGQSAGAQALDGVPFEHSIPLPPAVATVTWNGEEVKGKTPHMRRPCGGRMSRFRQKGIELSNAFRKALGLPIIENHPHPHLIYKSGPLRSVTPTLMVDGIPVHQLRPQATPVPVPHHRHHHHHGMRVHRVHGAPFVTRLHYSLMNLGRWEGRAVAFVLGCGIGVLLRMFWVLAIVTYRAIKGQREDVHEYSHITIIEEYDETPIQSPPPTYSYPVDEKVDIKEDEAVKALATTEESK